jgi:U4/U6 small nuclear ribonucleoprotein PRP3
LVIVEGGHKGLRRYKKLMLRRIKWDEEPEDDRDEEVKSEEEEKKDGEEQKEMEKDESFAIANNRCDLIWEVCPFFAISYSLTRARRKAKASLIFKSKL